jgi:hypothetical protein
MSNREFISLYDSYTRYIPRTNIHSVACSILTGSDMHIEIEKYLEIRDRLYLTEAEIDLLFGCEFKVPSNFIQ